MSRKGLVEAAIAVAQTPEAGAAAGRQRVVQAERAVERHG